MSDDLQLQTYLIKWGSLEPWKLALAKMVIDAYINKKYMRSHYQRLIFEPLALMQKLIEGKFIWGVENWETIDPKDANGEIFRYKPKDGE